MLVPVLLQNVSQVLSGEMELGIQITIGNVLPLNGSP